MSVKALLLCSTFHRPEVMNSAIHSWICLSFFLLVLPVIAEGGFLPPFLSPFFDTNNLTCANSWCGKGDCKVSKNMIGFTCECHDGWKKLSFGDQLPFLPCIIPDCNIDSSCSNNTLPSSPPTIKNWNITDPCSWFYCGNGSCEKGSDVGHKCICEQGYDNLLNETSFPCYKQCAFGMDCASLRIPLQGQTPSSTPTKSAVGDSGNTRGFGGITSKTNVWFTVLFMISLVISLHI